MMSPREIFYQDENEMARALAETITRDLRKGVAERGFGLMVLPGGRSPVLLINILAQMDLPWAQIVITTTDERCVARDDPNSNAGQIERLLAVQGVRPRIVSLQNGIEDLVWPADVCVCGMGLDGHFASIFPGRPGLEAGKDIVQSRAPVAPYERLSLPLDLLLQTRRFVLLVPDADKYAICKNAMTGQAPDLPVSALFRRGGDKIELHITGADT